MNRLVPLFPLCLAAPPVAANTWPPEVQAIVNENSAVCEEPMEMRDGAVTQVDLNGDGRQDWVIDGSAMACPELTTAFCGSAGCSVTTLIDGHRGDLLLHGWGVETAGGKTFLTAPNDAGQTVRFRWTGSEWKLP